MEIVRIGFVKFKHQKQHPVKAEGHSKPLVWIQVDRSAHIDTNEVLRNESADLSGSGGGGNELAKSTSETVVQKKSTTFNSKFGQLGPTPVALGPVSLEVSPRTKQMIFRCLDRDVVFKCEQTPLVAVFLHAQPSGSVIDGMKECIQWRYKIAETEEDKKLAGSKDGIADRVILDTLDEDSSGLLVQVHQYDTGMFMPRPSSTGDNNSSVNDETESLDTNTPESTPRDSTGTTKTTTPDSEEATAVIVATSVAFRDAKAVADYVEKMDFKAIWKQVLDSSLYVGIQRTLGKKSVECPEDGSSSTESDTDSSDSDDDDKSKKKEATDKIKEDCLAHQLVHFLKEASGMNRPQELDTILKCITP